MDTDAILKQLLAGEITNEQAKKMIDRPCTWEISDKDCIIFRGIRKKYPISLYFSEVESLRDATTSDDFIAWAEINKDRLSNPKGKMYKNRKK